MTALTIGKLAVCVRTFMKCCSDRRTNQRSQISGRTSSLDGAADIADTTLSMRESKTQRVISDTNKPFHSLYLFMHAQQEQMKVNGKTPSSLEAFPLLQMGVNATWEYNHVTRASYIAR